MRHFIFIRSAYKDVDLSRRRLNLSLQTIIPSLTSQGEKDATILLAVNANDPHLEERLGLFRSTGFTVKPYAEKTSAALLPKQTTLQTRVDDDDCLSYNFFWKLYRAQASSDTKNYFAFNDGLIYHEGTLYRCHMTGNMFGSVVLPVGQHIFQENHRALWTNRQYSTCSIDQKGAWIWVRHPDTQTTCSVSRLKNPVTLPDSLYPKVCMNDIRRCLELEAA